MAISNKGQILEKLSKIQSGLNDNLNDLKSIVSTPIWNESLHDELDEVVEALQKIKTIVDDLHVTQSKVIFNSKE